MIVVKGVRIGQTIWSPRGIRLVVIIFSALGSWKSLAWEEQSLVNEMERWTRRESDVRYWRRGERLACLPRGP